MQRENNETDPDSYTDLKGKIPKAHPLTSDIESCHADTQQCTFRAFIDHPTSSQKACLLLGNRASPTSCKMSPEIVHVPHLLSGCHSVKTSLPSGWYHQGTAFYMQRLNKTENGALTFPFLSTPFTNQFSRKG